MTTNEKTLKTILAESAIFTDRVAAFEYASTASRTLWVMMYDAPQYIVTTPANCARLEQMGYEWAD